MKKIIILSVICLILFNFCFVDAAPIGAAQHAIVKTKSVGDVVSVTIRFEKPMKPFAYQCALKYDKELLEFSGVSDRYFSDKECKELKNGVLYLMGTVPVAYEFCSDEDGTIKYASTAIKKAGLIEKTDIVKFNFVSKGKGECYIIAENSTGQTETDDGLVYADTYFEVSAGEYSSISEIYQEVEVSDKNYNEADFSNAVPIMVNYVDGQVLINVAGGKVLCSVENPLGNYEFPVILKETLSGAKQVKNAFVDRTDGKIMFDAPIFGKYLIMPSKAQFDDVYRDDCAYEAIMTLASNGIISGYGMFEPDRYVTKAEFLKMLIEISDEGVDNSAKCSYEDVSIADWFYPYIASAKKYGAIADGNYAEPNSTLSSVDVKNMIEKIKGVSIGNIEYSEAVTRAEAANIIYIALKSAFLQFKGVSNY